MDGKLLFLMICLYSVQKSQQTGWTLANKDIDEETDGHDAASLCRKINASPAVVNSLEKAKDLWAFLTETYGPNPPAAWLSTVKHERWEASGERVNPNVFIGRQALWMYPTKSLCPHFYRGLVTIIHCNRSARPVVCEETGARRRAQPAAKPKPVAQTISRPAKYAKCRSRIYNRDRATGRKYGYCWKVIQPEKKTLYSAFQVSGLCQQVHGRPVTIDSKDKKDKLEAFLKETGHRYWYPTPSVWLSDIKNQKWTASNNPVSIAALGISYVPEDHVCTFLSHGKVQTTSCKMAGTRHSIVCEEGKMKTTPSAPKEEEFEEIEPAKCHHAEYSRDKVTGEKFGYCWLVADVDQRAKFGSKDGAKVCKAKHGRPVTIDSKQKVKRLRDFLQATVMSYRFNIPMIWLSEIQNQKWLATNQKVDIRATGMKSVPARPMCAFLYNSVIATPCRNPRKMPLVCEEE